MKLSTKDLFVMAKQYAIYATKEVQSSKPMIDKQLEILQIVSYFKESSYQMLRMNLSTKDLFAIKFEISATKKILNLAIRRREFKRSFCKTLRMVLSTKDLFVIATKFAISTKKKPKSSNSHHI